MTKCTQSLRHWLFENGYKKELVYIEFGHTEFLTEDMWNRYIEWCKTDEGRQYLKGGSKYVEEGRAELKGE